MSVTALITPHCLWNARAILGEGVLWDEAGRRVWFVDIKACRIHCCDADGGSRRSWAAPGQVSFIVPDSAGGFVCSLDDGLYRFSEQSGSFRQLVAVEPEVPRNRFNDGHVDAQGRLWFGSMDDAEATPAGALYCFDGKDVCRMDDGYVITNGPALSPDGRVLYHTDTFEKRVYAFDLAEDGRLSGKRVFIEIADGYPDGMAVDSMGFLWIAIFGGWRVDRYDNTGRKCDEVRFPCANVTKLAFGGEDLRSVYVSTARKGLSAADLDAQALAGALFTFRAPAPGLPQHRLQLED